MAKRFMGINPKHKGFCTPMTKSTCTPRRKALARTLKKHHGFHKQLGGEVEAEGEVSPAEEAPMPKVKRKGRLPRRHLKKRK